MRLHPERGREYFCTVPDVVFHSWWQRPDLSEPGGLADWRDSVASGDCELRDCPEHELGGMRNYGIDEEQQALYADPPCVACLDPHAHCRDHCPFC